jgi:AcrR family transcriptional regulator
MELARKAMDDQAVNRERSRILAQAQRVIEAGGLKDLSMRSLAARLGFTATTLYRYFASKDELALSLLAMNFTRLRDGIAARIGQKRQVREKLQAAFEEYVRFGIEEKNYYNVMFGNDYSGRRPYDDPREEAASMEARRISADIIRLIGDALGPRAEAAELRIAEAWAMLHGFISLHNSGVLAHMPGDPQRLNEEVVQRALDILLVP